ncbi:hypothetical protein [Pseudomonas xionganensis]|uniref:Uncharacterized protein n=1 Tax=Pseudomonas xionganensis TaxID=2654845 RepID=A0A6I4KUM6_9PSED|nr:hypothetical protein [Pseudomonas xionganensis]MVW75398.1 hypothetical protein [Pseudomonas xionganensis]
MPTLAEQRRAIRDGITASRQATAGDERKAIGKRLEAERRGTAVVEDLNRLVQQPAPRRTLRPVTPLGALPPTSGQGNYKAPPATTPGGGGIASPLTEVTRTEGGQVVPDRDYWPSINLYSSDGLMTFKLAAIKQAKFTDADGAAVAINYAEVPE